MSASQCAGVYDDTRMAMERLKVGVVGASGYVGAELVRLCLSHPRFELSAMVADSQAGSPVSSLAPNLAPELAGRHFAELDVAKLAGLDLVFLALPHLASARLVPELMGRVAHIVDLSAAFRLRDPAAYPRWYGFGHPAPELLGRAAYGMPELSREGLGGAELIAVAGCYVTAAVLGLAPVVRAGLVDAAGLVVDAASGVSGAGRALSPATQFCAVDGGFSAYSLASHRHTPEMEQALGASKLLFTPHLAPMSRGILATCYGTARGAAGGTRGAEAVAEALREAYSTERFVVVSDEPPGTKATVGSNSVHVFGTADERSGRLVVVSALDNLVKGAAGQAVQCANLAAGLPEESGLFANGLYP